MQKRGVEYWDRNIRWLDNQRKFRAPENDALRSSLPQLFNLPQHEFLAFRLEDTQLQLVRNNSLEVLSCRGRTRHQRFDPVMLVKPFGDESAFHRILRADKPHPFEVLLLDCNSGGVRNVKDWNAG